MDAPETGLPEQGSSWKTRVIVVAVVVLMVVGAVYVFGRETESSYTPIGTGSAGSGAVGLKVGDQAPDFVVTGLDGQQIRLSSLRGKAVWINFWATWCPPCRAEMPDIEAVWKQKGDGQLVVLAVDIGEDDGTVRKFMKDNGYSFGVGLDQSKMVSEAYRIIGTPTHFFIDKTGVIRSVNVGAISRAQMLKRVEQLLN